MNFIVAVDLMYGIGKSNKLLTYLPDDLKYFKRVTKDKVVVMGRKTLESLPGGKPLVHRTNIVLSRDVNYHKEGVTIVHNLDELKMTIAKYPTDDIFIIGGGHIYNLMYPYCNFGYITKLDKDFEADVFIENADEKTEWSMVWTSDWREHKGLRYQWTKYENEKAISL